jgi:LysM repeat protein
MVDVARAYYGDNEKATILLWYNRISDPKKILPGTKIAIPTITRYPVKKGDTLGTLAHRFLGDQRRHKFLAMINQFKSTQALTIGSIIIIPFHIPHVVKKGESLTVIANRYFGDPNKFRLIKSYNFIDDPRAIDPGMEILIPIVDVEVKAGFDPSRHASTSALLPEEQLGFPWLEEGVHLYCAGEYRAALQNLKEALKRGLKRKEDISKAYRFRAYCHIALGEGDLGKKALKEALAIDPGLKLDPNYISPKIMGIFEEVQRERVR